MKWPLTSCQTQTRLILTDRWAAALQTSSYYPSGSAHFRDMSTFKPEPACFPSADLQREPMIDSRSMDVTHHVHGGRTSEESSSLLKCRWFAFMPSRSAHCFLCRWPGTPVRNGRTDSLPPPGCWRCSCSSAAAWWSSTWWGSCSPRWSPTGTHTLRSDPASFTAETHKHTKGDPAGCDDPRCVQGPCRESVQLTSDQMSSDCLPSAWLLLMIHSSFLSSSDLLSSHTQRNHVTPTGTFKIKAWSRHNSSGTSGGGRKTFLHTSTIYSQQTPSPKIIL